MGDRETLSLPPARTNEQREVAPGVASGAEPRARAWSAARGRLTSQRWPLPQLLVLGVVLAWACLQLDGFATAPSLRATAVIGALLAIAALGQTLVVLIGGLDMAVPGYMTVGAVAVVVLPTDHGWALWQVAALVVAITAAAGATTGVLCHALRVQPLVVSLGISAMLTGGALIATGADFMGAPPQALTELTSTTGTTAGAAVPPIVVIVGLTMIVVSLILGRTVLGRYLYATGANPTAAGRIHIPTGLIWTGTFAVSAAITGLAGMLVAGFSSGANLSIGEPYFFSGLAAVLVGGTALGSAQGSFTRTVLGALTLTVLSTILTGAGMDDGTRRVMFGLLIVVVVLLYARDRRVRDRL